MSLARQNSLVRRLAVAGVLSAVTIGAGAQMQTPAKAQPPGEDKTAKTRALEIGAKVLQGNAPVAKMDIYLNGFHPMKDDPGHQMEAHHFCHQMNQDFAQCALFDGNGAGANLNGIEYIISEKLFATLARGRSASTGTRTTARSSPASWSRPAFRRSPSTR